MAMEVPIILGVEGEAKGIIEDADAGICIEPENTVELKAAVMNLFEHKDLCAHFGASGRRFATEYFDRTVLARRYESILASTLESWSVAERGMKGKKAESDHE